MTPITPYLIRAVRDWAIDSGLTPLIVVDATLAGVEVPADFVENGRILLNVHPRAVHDFVMENERLLFATRFAGKRCALEIPVAAVLAIYARENGQGVTFPKESRADANDGDTNTDGTPKTRPHLKLVK